MVICQHSSNFQIELFLNLITETSNNNNCDNSYLIGCSDPNSIKLNKCSNNVLQSIDINCIGHWIEGSTTYLIGRTINNQLNQKRSYKCLIYTQTNQQQQQQKKSLLNNNQDYIELSKNNNLIPQHSLLFQQKDEDIIQISVSQDEFCRNIDNIIDDSYTLSKGLKLFSF